MLPVAEAAPSVEVEVVAEVPSAVEAMVAAVAEVAPSVEVAVVADTEEDADNHKKPQNP